MELEEEIYEDGAATFRILHFVP